MCQADEGSLNLRAGGEARQSVECVVDAVGIRMGHLDLAGDLLAGGGKWKIQ
jgi:hypothetical protein